MPIVTLDQARAAKAVALERLGKCGLENIVGVGITRTANSYAVKVNLGRSPAGEMRLPQEIDGVPLQFEVVGSILAGGLA
jgi:hypothetical protein